MNVKIKIFDGGKKPEYKRIGDACLDCYSRIDSGALVIPSGERTLISLGFALELSPDYEAVIRPRSGLTSKCIDIGIGTIDSNYRGEIKACVINNSLDDFEIKNGDRICQLAIRKVPEIIFEVVDKLSETERGEKGFGSTGV